MRILHTSDWHLGRSLHGISLHEAQRDFIAQIVAITRERSVDAVVIAGDIFDRGVAPLESVELFTEALADLVESADVIVSAGNHDSPARLGFGSPLHRREVHVVTSVEQVGTAIRVDRGEDSVLIYPIPFLDPDAARIALGEPGEPLNRSHEAVMSGAMSRIRENRAVLAAAGDLSPTIIVAHAFVVGGASSDSERDIRVGGVDSVAAGTFEGVDYVALGHLHGPQRIATENESVIEYSGSPLRYSFSEANHNKSVTLVDIAADGTVSTIRIPLTQPRAMARLEGPIDEVLSEENVALYEQAWVQAVVTDAARPTELHERVRAVLPHAISILHRPPVSAFDATGLERVMASNDPVQICRDFYQQVTSSQPSAIEQAVLARAYEAAKSGAGA